MQIVAMHGVAAIGARRARCAATRYVAVFTLEVSERRAHGSATFLFQSPKAAKYSSGDCLHLS
jgi:hypothetical protein